MQFSKTLFAILFSFFYLKLEAQNKTLPQITPKSPNAAAFDKYTDIPVSLSSGTINLNIPLYEMELGSIKVPINLSYYNNGLRPDEIASWTGLGWSLSGGGQISYQQKGLNDFNTTNGMFYGGQTVLNSYFANELNETQKQLYFEDVIAGNIDSEYDLFNYSLIGANGSFHFVSSTEARLNPRNDIKISKTTNGFKCIDANGNTFFFEAEEAASSYNLATDAISGNFDDNSTYHLSKIISPNSDSVIFKYKEYFFQYTKTSKYIKHSGYTTSGCPGSDLGANEILTTINYLLPDSIISRSGVIKFNHSQSLRSDLIKIDAESEVPYLSSIEVFNYDSIKIKDFVFYQSYFDTDERIRLDSVKEIASTLANRKWAFDYYGQNDDFPSFFSTAKDHWGYANVNTANTSIPEANYSSFLPLWHNYTIEYADRTSDYNSSIKGVLKTITYPTGGKSEFEYEPNQFKVNSYNDFEFGPFLKLPTTKFTENVTAASVTNGTTVRDTFDVGESGYFSVSSFKQLTPDPFYQSAEIIFSGPSASALNSATNQCNYTIGQCVSDNTVIFLEAGSYPYEVQGSFYIVGESTFYLNAWVEIDKQSDSTILAPYEVGGCRISKVTHMDSIANNVLIKQYYYHDSLSNVNFSKVPSYVTSVVQNFAVSLGCNSCSGSQYTIHDQNVRSTPGSVIEYGFVTERRDENGLNGKTDYNFLFSENMGGAISEPIAGFINTGWRSGNIVNQKTYRGGDSSLIMEMNNNYAVDSLIYKNGLKVNYGEYCSNGAGRTYQTNLATLYSESFKNTSTASVTYNDINQISINQEYFYKPSKHNSIDSSTMENSNSTKISKKIIYVFSYENLNAANEAVANGLKLLKDYFINSPVEEITIMQKNGAKYVVGGLLKFFKENQPVVDKVFELKINAPIPITDFVFSSVNSSGIFLYDTRYDLKASVALYDSYLNSLEQNFQGNFIKSYVWDYKSLFPVAEVINAPVSAVAYTSFEDEGIGNWTFTGLPEADPTAPTGKKVYNLSGGNLTKSITSTIPYIISYWRPVNASALSIIGTEAGYPVAGPIVNGWKYYEHKISGQVNAVLSGTGLIDEVRLFPKAAQMTTYTYEPLVGMTSQCDANNRITYYEYDGFGRLNLIRDQDKNILKKICYNYAGQPENCIPITYNNVAKSGTFTRNNCAAGAIGSSVTYTVAAGTYNSTISQADADVKAQNDVNANGQNYANTNGTCTWYNIAKSGTFTRNNCGAGGTGSSITYSVPAGTYKSTISQADADAKAQNDVNTNGQNYANTNGTCTWYNVTKSGIFTRNNCASGGTGSSVTYTVTAGSYSSTISQADADAKAQNDVNTNGQNYANTNGTCTWYNVTKSGTFTRNNCPSGQTGSSVTYTVAAGTYNSAISQADADQQAQNDINANGQNYANASGTCTQNCSFAASPGFSLFTSGISTSGSTVSFYIVFYSTSGFTSWSSTNQIATINGGCRPSVNRMLTMTESGRIWEVIIFAWGGVGVRLVSGTPPSGSSYITLTGGSYNL